MGFRDVKKLAIRCLQQGAYDHEVRGNIDVKNLFATGQVDKNGGNRTYQENFRRCISVPSTSSGCRY